MFVRVCIAGTTSYSYQTFEVIPIPTDEYDIAAVAERPIAAALRAVWSRTGPHGFESHPPRFCPMPNGTGNSMARISGLHPLHRGSIPLLPLTQHILFWADNVMHYIEIKIILEQEIDISLQLFLFGDLDIKYINKSVCHIQHKNYANMVDSKQKDYETALQIVREMLRILQKGYYPDGTKQKARCVDCTYRNICV